MRFDELLARYKAEPRIRSVALLSQDPNLLRYCICFSQLKPVRVMDWAMVASWDGLWDCVNIDLDALAVLADDVEPEARRQMERLKGLRLAYPDGTIQPLITKIIEKRARSMST